MLAVRRTASVANELETTDHLANSEETKRLGSDNTDGGECDRIQVSHARQEALGVVGGLLSSALGSASGLRCGSVERSRGIAECVLQGRHV